MSPIIGLGNELASQNAPVKNGGLLLAKSCRKRNFEVVNQNA
jgi:hypothetical protein